MNFEAIAIVLIVGLLAGWLAGFVMKGGGYGLVGDVALGLIGGIAGVSVLGMLDIAPAGSRSALLGAAFLGAAILIVAQRKLWNVDEAAAAR